MQSKQEQGPKKELYEMLNINSISKTFFPGTVNEKVALNKLSLTMKSGEFLTVIGGNGAGKSTLLNTIAGGIPVDEGSIILKGVDITKLPLHKRAGMIGRVFQDPMKGTIANMSLSENLALASRRGKKLGLRWGINDGLIYRDRLALLDLGLEDRMYTKVGLLSGGQRQAVTLMMAILQKPDLLLLDEHTAALDPKTAKKILELTEELVRENNQTTLMITHNMRDAINLGNRLIMMDDGKIVLDLEGAEKRNLTVSSLLEAFESKSDSIFDDAALLAV